MATLAKVPSKEFKDLLSNTLQAGVNSLLEETIESAKVELDTKLRKLMASLVITLVENTEVTSFGNKLNITISLDDLKGDNHETS